MDSHDPDSFSCQTSRRQFFGHAGVALGSIAFAALDRSSAVAKSDTAPQGTDNGLPGPLEPKPPAPRADPDRLSAKTKSPRTTGAMTAVTIAAKAGAR